ncbi:uncharacterized protein LOC128728692 [Anopheles nili]|uniref:uncharacterized protein LOC128728692 n=1 Tax=Anopheles nili TaxID=185578 RepID=UPI00237B5B50|nr:uncharacterized protein LOC128728692 [Anopheles nili]
MNKLLAGGLFLALAGPLVSGSLFSPFGPFGPAAQLPAYGAGAGAGAFPGAAAGLPFFPARPGVGQLPAYPPFYPPSAYLPAGVAPAFPPTMGRTLPLATPAPVLPAAATGNLRAVATNADVLGRLAVADLPEDLQQRAQELQLASDQGFDACEQLLQTPGAYWQYKRCNAFQLRTVLTAAKALEQEATARTTAAAPGTTPTEPAQTVV